MGENVRDRLVVALDVGDLAAAEEVVRRISPWFGVAKVGHELYADAGPTAFDRMHSLGLAVFCDLKLHDIPNTVERAARAHARHGVEIMNAHAAGGESMLRAFVAGAHEGARDAGCAPPITLAVTVLTSESDTSAFATRLEMARTSGCDGVVCSGAEIKYAHGAGLKTLVPGIRFAGTDAQDQVRVFTPADAARAGADWLVIGRAVTGADDPEEAASRVASEVAEGLTGN